MTINTLATYNGTTDSKLFFARGAGFFDGTSAGGSATPVVSGLSNDQWQTEEFTNSASDHFFVAVNGQDDPILYNGTSYLRLIAGNGVDPYTISGLDPSLWVHVKTHQKRLWFVETASTKAWYLATGAIYGTATEFDFGPLFTRGGYLMALMTWTLDAGTGSDDHLVAVSSKGEAVVYQGTDPAFADSWTLVGVYYIGEPIGRRCFCKMAGDLAILTSTGVFQLSQALQSTEVNANATALTDIIQLYISDLISSNGSYFGWCIIVVPRENWLVINVPQADGTSFQLVMNTVTQRWCTFTGWSTNCLTLFQDYLFFATNDKIYKAGYGNLDYVLPDGSGGVPIPFRVKQAYNFMGDEQRGVLKLFTLAQPTFFQQGGLAYSCILTRDYDESFSANYVSGPDTRTAWDTAYWDTAYWGGKAITYQRWFAGSVLGYAFSIQIQGEAITDSYWVSTNIIAEPGGLLG